MNIRTPVFARILLSQLSHACTQWRDRRLLLQWLNRRIDGRSGRALEARLFFDRPLLRTARGLQRSRQAERVRAQRLTLPLALILAFGTFNHTAHARSGSDRYTPAVSASSGLASWIMTSLQQFARLIMPETQTPMGDGGGSEDPETGTF